MGTLEQRKDASMREPRGPQSLKKKAGKARKVAALEPENRVESPPIVGIGASAGGLEALEVFFGRTPPDSDMAFVVIQHLSPSYKSTMDDLLRKKTRLEIKVIEDGTRVKPGVIYLNPPDREVAVFKGVLQLVEPTPEHGFRLPIDYFFRSLADDQGERAVCVILSGTGTDGTSGLRAIKEAGGLIMVQDASQAKYDGMPRSAIQTGLVDYVLPVEDMPQQLLEYVRQPYVRGVKESAVPENQDQNALQKIFMLIRSSTGHDFSNYKTSTTRRRIERRMALRHIETLDNYLRFLQGHPADLLELFRDMLIGVTGFFRDPEAFLALGEKVLDDLFLTKPPGSSLRIWVPGCATGEEAYTIAILIAEALDKVEKDIKVQIFASDIDDRAIEQARVGDYAESLTANVSSERLERYFVKEGNGHRIKKQIREMLVFAVQNVIADPPFSKLDLISCRNLLIYMDPVLQKKILSVFHYSLNEDGYVLLGSSETLGEYADLFTPVDSKWKIFRLKGSAAPHKFQYARAAYPEVPRLAPKTEEGRVARVMNVRELAERTLLEKHSPPCVLINDRFDILYVKGATDRYLSLPTGDASLNLLKMVREGLRSALSTGLFKAGQQRQPVICAELQYARDGEVGSVTLTVRPIHRPGLAQNLFLVVFDEKPSSGRTRRTKKASAAEEADPQILQLEQELQSTKDYLETTNKEFEITNEELKAANEELQSANEELQSSNEELETSREEIQSTNEELLTVNSELQNKLEALSQVNNDINNLLASTEVGTIFLDNHLKIKRFTPSMSKLVNFIPADIGRPISDVTHKIAYDRLYQDAQEVLDTLHRKEVEVQARSGAWFSLRIMPYRTVDNVIDGVVLTFVDITKLKEAGLQAQDARTLAEAIVNGVTDSLLVLDAGLRVMSANSSFYRAFDTTREQTEGMPVYELGNGQWNIPELRELLEQIVPNDGEFRDFQVEHDFPGIGRRTMLLNAQLVPQQVDRPGLILLTMVDVSDKQ
jgi:two-component system CheB/CheR fusion protein